MHFAPFILPLVFLIGAVAYAGDPRNPDDPHYTTSGFFDVHICNWPDRAPFYMVLYSTENHQDIQSVDISGANGKLIGKLDLETYRFSENEPGTRILISHLPISRDYEDGWFVAKIRMKNGETQTATDLVIHKIMPEISGYQPKDGAEDIPLPDVLTWDDTFGAYWYRVWIRDNWNDRK
ncbi:MAG: hypothetical protein JSW45_03155, partial [Thiotrichales bacterium]